MKKVYEDAIVEYKKAIKKDPNYAQGYFNLSTAFNGLNEGKKSVLTARKAMELFEKQDDRASAAKARKRLRELYSAYEFKPEDFQ
ncbi:MAG: tetratricopeptide repeat protein [Nitrospinaceae bacterium]